MRKCRLVLQQDSGIELILKTCVLTKTSVFSVSFVANNQQPRITLRFIQATAIPI
jgi:hypothetical protein